MKIIECRGSNTRIGQTIGEALRQELHEQVTGFLPADLGCLQKEAALLKASLEKHAPGVLKQMLATASAGGISELQILALNCPSGSADYGYEQGCSNAVFGDGPDGPIWGKNNEGHYPPADKPVVNCQGPRPVCALKLYPDHGIPAICFTFVGWFSGADMINAEGLATGHSSVGSKFQQAPHHVSVLQWLYKGMFEMKSVGDYARHVTSMPLRGKGFSQVVVDAKGNMASGELACPIAQIRWPANGLKAMNCVNHYQLPQLEGRDGRAPEGLANSKGRQAFLDAALLDGDRSITHMKRILASHGEYSICRHGGKDQSFTEYSMIGLPRQRKALLAHGNPCATPYVEICL